LPLAALPAAGRTGKSEAWARKQFAAADRAREALNGRPVSERSRRQYQQAINAYRLVYYGAPTSTKADPSVVAVAELMVEMGRRFDDSKILRSAIGQYQFLRREYPGSKYRCDALFTVGEIYKDDLDDSANATATFQEFLKRYPRNHLAQDARDALHDLQTASKIKNAKSVAKLHADEARLIAPADDAADSGEDSPAPSEPKAVKLSRITGIRHWSTPDYTRVAIDVEQDVEFSSQRIDHPERIFFDLADTKLASTLVGKTFDVDDGFLRKIRVAQFKPGQSRVVLEVDDLCEYDAFLLSNPSRVIIDIRGKQDSNRQARKSDPEISKPEAEARARDDSSEADTEPSKTAKLEGPPVDPTPKAKKPPITVTTSNGIKKTVVEADDDQDDSVPDATEAKLDPPEIKPVTASKTSTVPTRPEPKSQAAKLSKTKRKPTVDLDIHEAQPTSSGDRSLIRALGLKIGKIVIDPGHGGHDTGTIGPNGLLEKDLVLDVAKRLGKQLERLGAEVVYTRNDDTFIPLETRTAIANQERADLFVSIHANASHDPDARGVETYYLNFTSSSDALEVAARENAVSDKSIHELQDLVKKIALKEKIEESREFASDVQHALHTGLSNKNPGLRDRGVKKAPFIVLIGANMPSILAEISFVSNPGDERRLQTPEYRQRIATSLYDGISKYVGGLSGVKVASKIDKEEEQ